MSNERVKTWADAKKRRMKELSDLLFDYPDSTRTPWRKFELARLKNNVNVPAELLIGEKISFDPSEVTPKKP